MPEPTAAELNATIARWVGWRLDQYWISPGGTLQANPPAYASDLNEWREVFVKLNQKTQRHLFVDVLFGVLKSDRTNAVDVEEWNQWYIGWICMTATALQRAEALARVIGGGE